MISSDIGNPFFLKLSTIKNVKKEIWNANQFIFENEFVIF
jgi:hypothetical protein